MKKVVLVMLAAAIISNACLAYQKFSQGNISWGIDKILLALFCVGACLNWLAKDSK